MLSQREVDVVYDLIVEQGVTFKSLQVDLLDHLCCMVESNMEGGRNFQESLSQTVHEFGLNNLGGTQEATIYLLTSKTRKMKKAISLIAILAAILVLTGIAFKINSFPGANQLFTLGVLTCALAVFPGMAYFEFKSTDNSLVKASVLTGYLSGILLSLATLFKFMQWPGAGPLYYIGLFALVLIFIPLYTFKNYRTAENKLFAIAKSLLIISGIAVIWSSYRMIDMTIQQGLAS
ncbi:MAG: hypothetical protein SchgKO_05550 [Schleiferiaceae bacterium]